MGNRGGRFHLPGQMLGARRWASRQWIACLCRFRGRQRPVWGQGYTELFFLDEITAFASGHRPCFECRRDDALAFQARFAGGKMRAAEMDRVLHEERLALPRPPVNDLSKLPDGAMVAVGQTAFAVKSGGLLQWGFAGYRPSAALPQPGSFRLLTPASIVTVLERGYLPLRHSSTSGFG